MLPMLFHPVEMSNNCKKKGRKEKRKKYLTSDLSSGINKRLSPNVKKKRQVKFAVCNFVCFAESFDCFCFSNHLIKFILGHSMKLCSHPERTKHNYYCSYSHVFALPERFSKAQEEEGWIIDEEFYLQYRTGKIWVLQTQWTPCSTKGGP